MSQGSESNPENFPTLGSMHERQRPAYDADSSPYMTDTTNPVLFSQADSQLPLQPATPPEQVTYQPLPSLSPMLSQSPSDPLQDPLVAAFPLDSNTIDNQMESTTMQTHTEDSAQTSQVHIQSLQKQIQALKEQNRIITQRLQDAEAQMTTPTQQPPLYAYSQVPPPAAPPSKRATSLASLPLTIPPQPGHAQPGVPPPYHVPSMQAVLAKPRRVDPPNEAMDEASLRFLEQLLSSFPPTKRAMLEKKNKGYLLHYAQLYPMLQTKQRFRGYFKANLSRERQTGWIACPAFPDNVFCDLRQMNRQYSQIAEPGFAVEFSVTLNQREQSVFSAVNVVVFTPDQVPPEEKERYVCVYFASGRGCKKGYECPFLHVLPNTMDTSARYPGGSPQQLTVGLLGSRPNQPPLQYEPTTIQYPTYITTPSYIPAIQQPSQIPSYYTPSTSVIPAVVVDSPYVTHPPPYTVVAQQPTTATLPMRFVIDSDTVPATQQQPTTQYATLGAAPQATQATYATLGTAPPAPQHQLSGPVPQLGAIEGRAVPHPQTQPPDNSIPTVPLYATPESIPPGNQPSHIPTFIPAHARATRTSRPLTFEDSQLPPY